MGTRTTEANQLSWNVNELVTRNERGTMDFDFSVQRGYVWDNKRCSLLIHSVLLGLPISEFFLNKVGDKYQGLEGKQRNKALCDFVNGLYKLHLNTPPVELDDGSMYAVARHTFAKLPDELQDRIRSYSLRVYWFDNASIDDQVLIFTRINSGKPVTAADISRIRVASRDAFSELADHQAIGLAVREKAKMKYVDEDIVQDIWILSNIENPSLLNRFRSPLLESEKMTAAQTRELKKAFDLMLAFYKRVEENRKWFSKLRAKTHIISLGYMAVLATRNKIKEDAFVEKAVHFFAGEDTKVTVSEAYNLASMAGSAKPENVKIRMGELANALGIKQTQ